MISQQQTTRKRLDKFVLAAERLAAVQYEAGLHAADTGKRERVQQKVNRCWHEFHAAYDELMKNYTEVPRMIVRWSR